MATADGKAPSKKSVQFSADISDDNFNTTKVGLTPSVNRLAPRYKMPEERSAQAQCVAPPSSITRPNYEGTLERKFCTVCTNPSFHVTMQTYCEE
jgi:hypothetical protein